MIGIDIVSRVGEALYGEDWRRPLATELGISERSFRVWASGRAPVPPGLAAELLELLEVRDTEIAVLRAELAVAIAAAPPPD